MAGRWAQLGGQMTSDTRWTGVPLTLTLKSEGLGGGVLA